MQKHFYLTKRQWLGVLKWSLYSLSFLLLQVNQSVVLAHYPLWGLKLNLIPAMLLCVCLREGEQKGGIFCICANVFYCLSITDYGCLSVAVLTVLPMLAAMFFDSCLTGKFFPGMLCCFVISFLNDALILLFRSVMERTAISNLWKVSLPACALATVFYPLFYLLAHFIGKIGENNGN